jgi:hypothetical protein
MTQQLSPAAQAVLDAANSCNFYGPDDCLNESRWIAAAALRAAAEHSVPDDSNGYYVYLPSLLAIADELDA